MTVTIFPIMCAMIDRPFKFNPEFFVDIHKFNIILIMSILNSSCHISAWKFFSCCFLFFDHIHNIIFCVFYIFPVPKS